MAARFVSICTFRRENRALLDKAFSTVLELAARVGVMKVGQVTVVIDGTKVLANASKHAAASYEKAGERLRELDIEVAELLKKAEEAYNAQAGVEIESRMIVTQRVSQATDH